MKRNSDNFVFRMESVTKRFGGLNALSDINLSIREGEIVGLIGPNGAGKSTLFNVATSVYKPEIGDIYLRNKRITGKPSHQICRLGISRTFQLVKTFLSMTAFENVLIGAIYGHKLKGKEARREADDHRGSACSRKTPGPRPCSLCHRGTWHSHAGAAASAARHPGSPNSPPYQVPRRRWHPCNHSSPGRDPGKPIPGDTHA